MSDVSLEEFEERKKLYSKCREDLLKRSLSNTENFDRSILTLSSSLLGITLTFVRGFILVEDAQYLCCLILGWTFLVVAIITTLISFLISEDAIAQQIENAEGDYLDFGDECLNQANPSANWTKELAKCSAMAFILATSFLVFFVSFNLIV